MSSPVRPRKLTVPDASLVAPVVQDLTEKQPILIGQAPQVRLVSEAVEPIAAPPILETVKLVAVPLV